MPELPEVESVRLGLEQIIGQKILRVHLGPQHCIQSLVPKDSLDLCLLEGQTIQRIERKGKFLKISLEEYQLLVHLGMSGVLLYQHDPRPHTHIRLCLAKGDLLYSDPRRFGHWELKQHGDLLNSWEKLGPDALNPELNPLALSQRTQNSRRSIKDLILDQSIIAGIGNIYACEALFAAGVHPKKTGAQISSTQWQKICQAAKEIMELSIEHKGTTFSDYRLTNGKGGSFQGFLKVFQKEGLPCPQCAAPIVRITQQARSTFYCPHCQP